MCRETGLTPVFAGRGRFPLSEETQESRATVDWQNAETSADSVLRVVPPRFVPPDSK